jgi:hypothetical protein
LFGERGRPARSLWPPAKDICKNIGVTPTEATGTVALPFPIEASVNGLYRAGDVAAGK